MGRWHTAAVIARRVTKFWAILAAASTVALCVALWVYVGAGMLGAVNAQIVADAVGPWALAFVVFTWPMVALHAAVAKACEWVDHGLLYGSRNRLGDRVLARLGRTQS